MFRSRNTILLITPTILGRFDLVGNRVRQQWIKKRFESESTASLAEAAWKLGPKRGGTAWVLSTDFWTGVVRIPREVIQALSELELSQSVALEAETHSGISSFDSSVGFIPFGSSTDDESSWWVTQISRNEIEELEHLFRLMNVRMGGLSHPALAHPWAPPTNPWVTCQSWGEQQVCMHVVMQAGNPRLSNMFIGYGNIDSPRTRQEVQNWVKQEGGSNPAVLNHLSISESDLEGTSTHILASNEDWNMWATHWSRSSLKKKPESPVVRIPARTISPQKARGISLSLSVLTAVACFAHSQWQSNQITTIDSAISDRERTTKNIEAKKSQLLSAQNQNKAFETQLSELKQELETRTVNLEVADRLSTEHRSRWVDLVDAIIANADRESWLERWFIQSDATVLKGRSISVQSAHRFASRLESSLENLGWKTEPAEIQFSSDERLFEFAIHLRITKPPLPKPVPPSKKADQKGVKVS